jgi:hypothetical protein
MASMALLMTGTVAREKSAPFSHSDLKGQKRVAGTNAMVTSGQSSTAMAPMGRVRSGSVKETTILLVAMHLGGVKVTTFGTHQAINDGLESLRKDTPKVARSCGAGSAVAADRSCHSQNDICLVCSMRHIKIM